MLLAGLALSLAAGRLATSWGDELARASTVRISAPVGQVATQTEAALRLLQQTPGVASARALSEAEQQALLRMMSQQMARLTLRLCCDGDAFFAAYPPVLAHAVLAALRGRGLLAPTVGMHAHANTSVSTNAPPQAAPDILRHLVALLGCALPAKLLSRHLELVRRAAPEGENGGGRLAAEAAPGAAGVAC